MSCWSFRIAAIIVVATCGSGLSQAYEDDDLLCRPGWSPDLYHQQIWEQYDQQRSMSGGFQRTNADGAAAEQKSLDAIKSARRNRFEATARKRDELIARRKSESETKIALKAASVKSANKSASPNQ